MPKSGKQIDTTRVFFYIKSSFDYRKSFPFDELVRNAIKTLYFEGKNDPRIDDHIEATKSVIRRRINREIENYNKYKTYLRFYWSPEEEDILVGNAYPLPTDDDPELLKKQILGNAFLIERILTTLDPYKFETLCKRILSELGCQFVGKTRSTADGGIDFFGTLSFHEVDGNPLLEKFSLVPNAKVHLIGQAKRYSLRNIIGPQHIREFLGSALLLEFSQGWDLQKELAIENLPAKYLRPSDPIVWLFFSTSFATTSAKRLANQLGIHLQDGEDLARWIAYNPLSTCSQDENELNDALTKWLSL
jgi:hypothetical protein